MLTQAKFSSHHCIVLLLVTLTNRGFALQHQTGEYRLMTTLLDDYNKENRPVLHTGSPVNVTLEIALNQIVSMDTKGERFSIIAFIRQNWNDAFVGWKPKDYNNITTANTHPDNVWVPDITLYNNAEYELRGNLNQLQKRVILHHNGLIKWHSSTILTGKCRMNVQKFPFDRQECHLTFLSWSYDVNEIDLISPYAEIDMNSYNQHSEWKILEATQKKTLKKYDCCANPYAAITVRIILQRKALFHVIHLLLPMVMMAALTLLAFCIPSRSGERISFAVTMLLAMTLFMSLLAEKVPASANPLSRLGIFFNCLIFISIPMIFMLCYVSRMYEKCPRKDDRIPRWMRRYVFDRLAFWLRVRPNERAVEEIQPQPPPSRAKRGTLSFSTIPEDELFLSSCEKQKSASDTKRESRVVYTGESVKISTGNQQRKQRDLARPNSSMFAKLWDSRGEQSRPSNRQPASKLSDTATALLRRNSVVSIAKALEDREDKMFFYEWKICAGTMDRLLFYLFAVLFIATSLVCLF